MRNVCKNILDDFKVHWYIIFYLYDLSVSPPLLIFHTLVNNRKLNKYILEVLKKTQRPPPAPLILLSNIETVPVEHPCILFPLSTPSPHATRSNLRKMREWRNRVKALNVQNQPETPPKLSIAWTMKLGVCVLLLVGWVESKATPQNPLTDWRHHK